MTVSTKKPSFIRSLLRWSGQCLACYLLSVLLAWLLVIFCLIYFGQARGLQIITHLYRSTLMDLQSFSQSIWLVHPAAWAMKWGNGVFNFFVDTCQLPLIWHSLIEWLQPHSTSLAGVLLQVQPYFAAMLMVLQLLVVRFAILILLLPWMGLLMLAALIDGLAARQVRAYQGERESSLIYHQSKQLLPMSILIAGMLWWLMPWPIQPALIWLPFFLISAFLLYFMARYFKKQL